MSKGPDAAHNRPADCEDVIVEGQVRIEGDAECFKVGAE